MTAEQRRIPTAFSLYLDLVRFLAAVFVVLEHLRQYKILSDWQARLVPDAGRDAVIVFFVLSGFVIAYSTSSKSVSWRDYAVARISRIYSVALPVVLLSFMAAAIVIGLVGNTAIPGYQVSRAYFYVPFHMLFLGQLWNFSEDPPLLGPYWSLGFEAWYYVLFGVLFYMRGNSRLVAAAIVLGLMGHKLWLLLPIWAAGVSLFGWLQANTIERTTAVWLWCASVVLLAVYNASGLVEHLRVLAQAAWPIPQLQLGSADRVIADYLVCAIVALNFASARFARFAFLERYAGLIRGLAFFTFPLYLAHALVLSVWQALRPNGSGYAYDVLPVVFLVIVFTWGIGRGAEMFRLRMLSWTSEWRRRAQRVAPSPGQPS